MCIILYSPAGQALPSREILENCFYSNPDGAGFMYRRASGAIQIKKGFMTCDSLLAELQALEGSIGDARNTDVVLHFRLATQGGVVPGNCHPFPVSKTLEDLRALTMRADVALVHNGVIPFCGAPKKNKGWKKKEILSDTQIFSRDYLVPMRDHLFDPAFLTLVEEATSSKFIFMDREQTVLVGQFIEDQGILYSNDTYKRSRWATATSYPSKYSFYFDEYEDYDGSEDLCDFCGEYSPGGWYEGRLWVCVDCQRDLEIDTSKIWSSSSSSADKKDLCDLCGRYGPGAWYEGSLWACTDCLYELGLSAAVYEEV